MPSIPGWTSERPRIVALLLGLVLVTAAGASSEELGLRVYRAEEVWRDFLASERAAPQELLQTSKCIVILPRVLKGAVGVGGRHGKGVISCRRLAGDAGDAGDAGEWSPPLFVKLSGGSIGLQVGGEATDLVLFVVSERGAKSLLRSKLTLGADASVAAGTWSTGVASSTDLRMKAEVYSYASSKGLFAGAAVEGGHLSIQTRMIKKYYGRWIHPEALLFEDEEVELPTEAQKLLDLLPGG